jgi:hypothetical protein
MWICTLIQLNHKIHSQHCKKMWLYTLVFASQNVFMELQVDGNIPLVFQILALHIY